MWRVSLTSMTTRRWGLGQSIRLTDADSWKTWKRHHPRSKDTVNPHFSVSQKEGRIQWGSLEMFLFRLPGWLNSPAGCFCPPPDHSFAGARQGLIMRQVARSVGRGHYLGRTSIQMEQSLGVAGTCGGHQRNSRNWTARSPSRLGALAPRSKEGSFDGTDFCF